MQVLGLAIIPTARLTDRIHSVDFEMMAAIAVAIGSRNFDLKIENEKKNSGLVRQVEETRQERKKSNGYLKREVENLGNI